MAGERFHMVQNVSMAVYHIGREPTVRGHRAKAGGEQPVALTAQPSLCCLSLASDSLFLSSKTSIISLHFSMSVCLSPTLTLALPCQLCKVLNSTLITCPSPGALSNASAPVDFFINGRAYADEVAVAEELLDPEEARRGGRFRLDYLPDPQFSTAKREKWIKHHPGEPLTLVIHVSAQGCGGGAAGEDMAGLGSATALGEHPCSAPAEGAGQPGPPEPRVPDQDRPSGL